MEEDRLDVTSSDSSLSQSTSFEAMPKSKEDLRHKNQLLEKEVSLLKSLLASKDQAITQLQARCEDLLEHNKTLKETSTSAALSLRESNKE